MKKEFKSDSHGEAWGGGRIRGCLPDTEHLGSFRFLTWGWKSMGPKTCGWAAVAFSGGDWGIVPNSSRSQSTRPAVKGSEAMVSLGRSFCLRPVVKGDGTPPGWCILRQGVSFPLGFNRAAPFPWTCFRNDLKIQMNWRHLLHLLCCWQIETYYYIVSLLIPDVLHLKFYWVWYQYGYHRLLLVGTCLF